jgi:hypothetical protein
LQKQQNKDTYNKMFIVNRKKARAFFLFLFSILSRATVSESVFVSTTE